MNAAHVASMRPRLLRRGIAGVTAKHTTSFAGFNEATPSEAWNCPARSCKLWATPGFNEATPSEAWNSMDQGIGKRARPCFNEATPSEAWNCGLAG